MMAMIAASSADVSWVSIVAALIAVVSSALIARSVNRKADSEGADAISKAAVNLLAPLERRVEKLYSENKELMGRLGVLEVESAELETLRFENEHLRKRIKYLEIQVEMLNENNTSHSEVLEKLAAERLRSSNLIESVGILAGQVISFGEEPLVEIGEERVE